jgi:hypothetical protein
MSQPTIEQLRSELINDPAVLGYAPFVAAGGDADIANLINALSAARVNRGVVTTEVFLADFGMQVLTIFSDATLSSSFGALVKMLSLPRTIDYSHPVIQGALSKMAGAAVGGLTQANVNAITSRPASRAESIWGPGVSVDHLQVAKALRG